ncbi:ROK family protein [Proteus hauseri]|uniref:ROK family protein n=1 Tax=Proteus hauseri TaxID=183417 RepID=UPI0032DB6D13
MLLKSLKELQSSTQSKALKLKILYKFIAENGPIKTETLTELAQMKPATCARLLDELCHLGLITTAELGESTGGRKPILYNINTEGVFLIGIELSKVYSTIVLMDLKLNMLDKIKLAPEPYLSASEMTQQLLPKIEALLLKNKTNYHQVLGLGISIEHVVEHQLACKSLDEEFRELEVLLRKQIPTYITVGSGVNFAALAEYRLYYRHKTQRFLFTSCDTEVRGCAIIGNQFLTDTSRAMNCFGHMTIDVKGPLCECGSYGCLNTLCSLDAIKDNVIHQIRRGKDSVLTSLTDKNEEITYHAIFQAIEMRDPLCIDVLEEAAYFYGLAIANSILMLQPDIVVCGGTLIPKYNFFATVKKTIENKLTLFPEIKTQIYPASHAYEIVSQGAGAMVLEHLIN